jgi:hypothetical protein
LKKENKLLLLLIVAFIAATVIGTVSHESGHYFVARYLGYDAKIHYSYTTVNSAGEASDDQQFLVTLGGVLLTLITSAVGLILLFLFRKSFTGKPELSFNQWILIFISLFWLRQPANLFMGAGEYLLTGKFPHRFDEIKISRYLDLPNGSILILTAILGLIILSVVIFRFIPSRQRNTFILAGLIGGISGYFLWMKVFGKLILP